MIDPIKSCADIEASYAAYLKTTFEPRTETFRKALSQTLAGHQILSTGPYVQATPPFATGASIQDLCDELVLSPRTGTLGNALPGERALYLHQEQAIRKAAQGRNLIVSTGTGSGKTESFLVPIISHLFAELDDGTLNQPGVRALLLYPMNALANDQLGRLRKLLANAPELTFGRYTGETPQTEKDALSDFNARYPGEPRLPNELISRDQMHESPPHILLTNFAMLEYMLLRPSAGPLFEASGGNTWSFIVLDEVHVYNGAKGTEIAYLLRRVRDRVCRSAAGRLRCFATSATLGRGTDDYPTLARFATELFGEKFEWNESDSDRQDIVTATRLSPSHESARERIPLAAVSELALALANGVSIPEVAAIAGRHGLPTNPNDDSIEAALHTALAHEERVLSLRTTLAGGSVELQALVDDVVPDGDAHDLVALIALAAAARPDRESASLLPARYHFFIRALQGGYVCLHPDHPDPATLIALDPSRICDTCADHGIVARRFELGLCHECGAEYLVGNTTSSADRTTLEFASRFEDAAAERYLINASATDQISEDDVGDFDVDQALDLGQSCVVCPGCGSIDAKTTGCDCAVPPRAATMAKADGPNDGRRCIACGRRANREIVRRLLTGSDASPAVLATDLFQAIPRQEGVDVVGSGRKLLVFSDSRQDAAFFAHYLERTYGLSVQRHLILKALEGIAQSSTQPSTIIDRVVESALRAQVLDRFDDHEKLRDEVRRWIVRELVGTDRRQTLDGVGLVSLRPRLPSTWSPPTVLPGLSADECASLVRHLIDSLRLTGIIEPPDGISLRDEFFAPRNVEVFARLADAHGNVKSWIPSRGHDNRRSDLLHRVAAALGNSLSEKDANEVLGRLWSEFTSEPQWNRLFRNTSQSNRGTVFRLHWDGFEFVTDPEASRPSRCDTCRRITWDPVAGVCATWRCTGRLSPLDSVAGMEQHYARRFREIDPAGMRVEEHTAQWSAKEASAIQQRFLDGNVNVLSCSTTFELGVDVGELEAVFLRNVPPAAANYVQRAGRAGRRLGAAALVVTFAQRRNHDLTWFRDPRPMIDGHIPPPILSIENPLIARRHLHSVAFAEFERSSEEHKTVGHFFIDEPKQDRAFHDWIEGHPSSVLDSLERIFPENIREELGIEAWAWVPRLFEQDPVDKTGGWMGRAADVVRETNKTLDEIREEAAEAQNYRKAERVKKQMTTVQSTRLLNFLGSRNVLPKYGFPVDVVALDLSRASHATGPKLDLNRDLSLALSEFAPGEQIVAGKQLWESVGVAIASEKGLPTYTWGTCGGCGRYQQAVEEVSELEACAECSGQVSIRGTAVIPVFGFVGKPADAKLGDARPRRRATTERFFGSFAGTTPEFTEAPGMPYGVEARQSPQGRVVIVNGGEFSRHYYMCEWCGFMRPAPTRGARLAKDHDDARTGGSRKCRGRLIARDLAHEYLTDVLEVRVTGAPVNRDEATSGVEALVAAAPRLGIESGEIGGVAFSEPNGFRVVLFDTVPGGAGHARRIAAELPSLFSEAYRLASECSCGIDDSCYACLQSYRNQRTHEVLTRRGAIKSLSLALSP